MRGANKTKLPSKLYFIDNNGQMIGPYMNRPTTLLKKRPNATLVIYELDSSENYIKQ